MKPGGRKERHEVKRNRQKKKKKPRNGIQPTSGPTEKSPPKNFTLNPKKGEGGSHGRASGKGLAAE